MKSAFLVLLTFVLSTASIHAATNLGPSFEELDPSAKNIEETLKQYDAEYERVTGKSAFLESSSVNKAFDCFRKDCALWAQVSLSQQKMYVFINGVHSFTWKVSSGMAGFSTPTFDRHPNGRIYDAYTSTKFPEGDYNGLGNMPYAVFIYGGYAIHGTTTGNWKKLGTPASHGCIRLHPDNAKLFNDYVKAYGISDTWITVQR